MRKTTRLKTLIQAPKLLVMPGAYDALSAMLIEDAGFDAVQGSGFGLAASHLGLPDIGILGFREMLDRTRVIAGAVDIPVMADGDTGFGDAATTWHVVREFEAAGAAGINLEDQVMPKRCGHFTGKAVIPMEEMIGKLRAAADARRDADFIINARTDVLQSLGVHEAIRRGNAYAEAGATLIFVDGIETRHEVKRVIAEIDAPVSINMVEGGSTPLFTFAELEQLGAARVSCPVTTILAAMKGVQQALASLKASGTPGSEPNLLAGFGEIKDRLGALEFDELGGKFGA
ncbi:isocitrate lyase/PEP mutase family protein [Pseudohalocynthiibacter sp. F2068]|jgi:2-methylisocitrate lyase-like PEP mutase family enzyme|uniref:isocitrate lyase/PEP mutase family protein n=1 Tax=Pseudohalocynthiibacter sp. F2068 TaxID=2926418 RepID=UPI001FF11944|nr:isocitrate lyase/PEP mutase family protein [Pseudohalocynthiibacter sp. F2068]MCK0100684.1 isocitrate lyase/PEP mutase family protein [Pseudohalocynthiibacter sp. F2068]